jgi:hypothetical protein
MRVPEDRVQEVENLIGGGDLESVTESKAEPIEDIRRIVERWGEKLVPHQDASGQVKQSLKLIKSLRKISVRVL